MKIEAAGELHGRAIEEWVGKKPDTPVPPRVQLRILLRQSRLCAITGVRIDGIKVKAQCDHIKRLEAGGENRESNLQMIAVEPHKAKTADEEKVEKWVSSRQKTSLGIKKKSKWKKVWPKGRKFGQ